ncbi:MAG: hypothetical protein R2713_07145 [Ilumatobacteraceae bacterium]
MDRLSAFFDLVQQDPVISRMKLIAEPWDVGDGYQVGNFTVQRPNGTASTAPASATRGPVRRTPSGSLRTALPVRATWYEAAGPPATSRASTSSPPMTAFTMRDLVSWATTAKHNDANGEDNRDGESHNCSWNGGAEGPTDDADIEALRFSGCGTS